MSDFVEQLRLAEKAAEDIYFAKVDRELIRALHERLNAGKNPLESSAQSVAYTGATASRAARKRDIRS